MDMFRLDFSRGTVEKIDPSVPPRGWQASVADPEHEATPRRTGDLRDQPDSVPPAEEDEG